MTESKILQRVSSFNCLGCFIPHLRNIDIGRKETSFHHICDIIRRTLKIKQEALHKYKFVKPWLSLYGSKILARTKKDKSKVERAEIRILHPVAGVSL
jgi:hypothetical protein